MNNEFDFFSFHNLVNIAILLGLTIAVTRWVFMIPKLAKHSEAQTAFLKEIAAKNGVEESKIKEIMSKLD